MKLAQYGRVISRTCVQEWYESASRDARKRAQDLRKKGYRVVVENMGEQVTPEGRVRMTLLTIIVPEGVDYMELLNESTDREPAEEGRPVVQ